MTFFDPALAQRIAMTAIASAIVYPAILLDSMVGGDSYLLYFSWWELLHGLAFGGLVLAPYVTSHDRRPLRVFALMILSVFIYRVAIESPDFLLSDADDVIGYVVAGTVGATLVAVATKFIAPLDVSPAYWIYAVLAGALGGFVFNYAFEFCLWDTCDSYLDLLLYTSGWFTWQALVCIALYFGRARRPMDSES